MRKRKGTMMLLLIVLLLLLVGCKELQEQKAEKMLATYYEGLINGDVEQSIKVLYLHDQKENPSAGTNLAQDEAKNIVKNKMLQLEALEYRVLGYEISELEYEDGHSFWYHVRVRGEIAGEPFTYEDTIVPVEEKIAIAGDDPFIYERNGHVAQ